ncbi:MAG: hypothetical protein KA715_03815 [Xanthomonadaceae bacterium]|nr:hypothetical protein [Xanthomonadaceae bacterium]
MNLNLSSLLSFFVLIWTLGSPLYSYALDPGAVLNSFFSSCSSQLSESDFPKVLFNTIEPIVSDLDAPKLAAKLNGYQFKGKSGKTYTVVAHTSPETVDAVDDKVWIWILDENKIPLFSASQMVQKRVLTFSHIGNTISLFQKTFINHFNDLLRFKLEELTQMDLNKRFYFEVDWRFTPKTEVKAITLSLSNGLEKGSLKFTHTDAGWNYEPDGRLESIHPEIRFKLKLILKPGVFESAFSFAFNNPRTQALAQSQKPVLEAENDGIATALHEAYLAAVPRGTKKFISVGNTETLDALRRAQTHEDLIRVYPDTKLGKIFIKSGWKLFDIYKTETEGFLIEIVKP